MFMCVCAASATGTDFQQNCLQIFLLNTHCFYVIVYSVDALVMFMNMMYYIKFENSAYRQQHVDLKRIN